MGRPLIYICAVTIIVLGILQLNLNGRHIQLIERTSSYANESQMRNSAHSGSEFALNELRGDPTWRNNFEPFPVQLEYATAFVTIQDMTTNENLEEDQLRLISKVPFQRDSVQVIYTVDVVMGDIPEITGALNLTDSEFNIDLFSNAFEIDGNDESGLDPIGIPGISVIDQESKDKIFDTNNEDFLNNITGSTGTPSIEVDENMDFTDMAQLILALEANATYLEGNYTRDLNTPDNPGVFFVEDYAKIAGNVDGYGILVVRESGDLDLASLDLVGNFDFYGLVIFEDAWAFDGKGTATIHGAVMVGSPDEESEVDIEIGGTLKILYNSWALEFARIAAQRGVAPSFEITAVFE